MIAKLLEAQYAQWAAAIDCCDCPYGNCCVNLRNGLMPQRGKVLLSLPEGGKGLDQIVMAEDLLKA